MTSDSDPIRALDELGRRLDAAVTRRPARSRARRRRAAVLVAAALGLAAAPAVAVVTDGFDFGPDLPAPGERGGPPPPATGVPADRRLDVLELAQTRAGRAEMRRRLAEYGIGLHIDSRPVARAAVGRVFGVQLPTRARRQGHELVLERGVGGAVIVEVGRAPRRGEEAGTQGLSLYEVLPDVRDAVDLRDPAGTGRRLAELGYEVRWKLVIDNPDRDDPGAGLTGAKDVEAPPPGTQILSVLNSAGGNSATPDTRRLLIEIAPEGSEILEGHRP